jgi:hypothetical protein
VRASRTLLKALVSLENDARSLSSQPSVPKGCHSIQTPRTAGLRQVHACQGYVQHGTANHSVLSSIYTDHCLRRSGHGHLISSSDVSFPDNTALNRYNEHCNHHDARPGLKKTETLLSGLKRLAARAATSEGRPIMPYCAQSSKRCPASDIVRSACPDFLCG